MRRESPPPVSASAPSTGECADCSRRFVIQAIGMTAAASLFGFGCKDAETDGTPDGATSLDGTMMCGPTNEELCVLLGDPANAKLGALNGTRVIVLPEDKLIIVRRDGDTFVVLSAVCTFSACTVAYEPDLSQFECPCHDCRYALSGVVLQGPAAAPLRMYNHSYNAPSQTLTIVL